MAKSKGGLPAAALILTHQIRTLSSRRLSAAIGTLGDGDVREQIVRALRLWLDLTGD